MDRELEVIHGEMEGTRKSLADKLGEVESIIQEKVKEAGDSVTSIVDGVKEFGSSVSETVTSAKETLKDTFNIRKHVEDHPWGSLGAAMAVGFTSGLFLGSSRPSSVPAGAAVSSSPPPAPARKGEPGVMDTLLHNLQGLAVGSLMGVAQDLIADAAPAPWKESLTGMLDDLCVQLTGEKPTHFLQKTGDEKKPQQGSSAEEDFASEADPAWAGPAHPANRVHNGTRVRPS